MVSDDPDLTKHRYQDLCTYGQNRQNPVRITVLLRNGQNPVTCFWAFRFPTKLVKTVHRRPAISFYHYRSACADFPKNSQFWGVLAEVCSCNISAWTAEHKIEGGQILEKTGSGHEVDRKITVFRIDVQFANSRFLVFSGKSWFSEVLDPKWSEIVENQPRISENG